MSEPLAVVSVVGLVLGTVSITLLGVLCILRDKALRVNAGRSNVSLSVSSSKKRG